jgi:hypothetical protein
MFLLFPVVYHEVVVVDEPFIAMPLMAIARGDSLSRKKLKVNFSEDEKYFVRGKVDRSDADFWIEDKNGNVVSKLVSVIKDDECMAKKNPWGTVDEC